MNSSQLSLQKNKADTPPVQDKDSELILSVTELNRKVKSCLETNFATLWVKGEISNFKTPISGHFYFSLKDKKSQVRAVMFRGNNSRLVFRPEDGMEVLVKARVSLYEGTGSYQLICETMDPVGEGALKIQFEQLKDKLKKEGLFEAKHKKPIPLFPSKIAIVTSPTGAAIKDILNVIDRRFKGLNITIFPTMVQGESASKDIIRSIELANSVACKFDCMIVARGGGSMEDLWCFNDEQVARAIYNSKIPIVSGIGHEIDFTISDFVADVRAPTPSAAAMLVVKNKLDLEKELHSKKQALVHFMQTKVKSIMDNLNKTITMLVHPKRKVLELSQKTDDLYQRLEDAVVRNIKDSKRLLNGLIDILNSLSPLKTLTRGYSITKNMDGGIVKSIDSIKLGEKINSTVAFGEIISEVKELKESTWTLKQK